TTVQEADRIYRLATRPLIWRVRFFKNLTKEEYTVFVDAGTGEVFGHTHELDENAPGKALTQEEAQRLAEKGVEGRGYRLQDFDLESSQAQKRKARQDYKFVYEAKSGDPRNVAGARYRLEVEIAGDEVVGFSRHFKLPEEWLRRREASGIVNALLIGALVVF